MTFLGWVALSLGPLSAFQQGTKPVQAPPLQAPAVEPAPGNPVAVVATSLGDFTEALEQKPTRPPIQNEATNGLRNVRGTVAMARTPQLRSATAQFYVNVADNRMLDHTGYSPDDFGYAVFGRVLTGMDIVDKIAAVKTQTSGGMDDVPVEPVAIKGITLVK